MIAYQVKWSPPPLIPDTECDDCKFKFKRKAVDLIQVMVSFFNNASNVLLGSCRNIVPSVGTILKGAIWISTDVEQRQKDQNNYRT